MASAFILFVRTQNPVEMIIGISDQLIFYDIKFPGDDRSKRRKVGPSYSPET